MNFFRRLNESKRELKKSLAKGNLKKKPTVNPKKKLPKKYIYIYVYIKTMYTSISLTVTRK